MATDIITTIGATSSPVTPTYTSLQAWEDDIPADLVAADERHIGECLDQGEFTSGGNQLTIGGHTVDSTRYILLRSASGASFRDKAGVRSTALYYSASNGVAVRSTTAYDTTILCNNAFTRFEGLQIKAPSSGWGIDVGSSSDNCRAEDCLIETPRIATQDVALLRNCLIVATSTSGSEGTIRSTEAYGIECYGCTIVKPGASAGRAFTGFYDTTTVKNCAIFGYSTLSGGSSAIFAGSHNATDDATGIGSSNVTSLTFADQFEDSTNDFRAVSTGDLQAGTPDSTNTPDDITGLTRDATTPWIGCWEVAAAGGATPKYVFGKMFAGPFAGAI